MEKKVFIKTFGCQMNEYDSKRIYDSISKIGYQKTDLDTSGTAKFLEVQQYNSSCAAGAGINAGYFCGFPSDYGSAENPADGFEWDVNYVKASSGDATILGLGLVYAFNPNNTVTLSYEVKSFSFDAGTMT